MASDNEPAKLLLPYLQRADELQKHEPLVAYYCRLYAMERGLKIPQNERTNTTKSLLISLMKQLEKDKKSIQLGPEDNLYLEGFALNVFGKADKQDRAGRADLSTAKTFYAASIFFEILNQFGVVLPDLEQKQKYAAWKAADIRKAVKEGRKPQAGPPAGDDDLSVPSSGMSGSYDLGQSEDAVSSPGQQSDPPPQFYDEGNNQNSTNIEPSQFQDHASIKRSTSLQPHFHDEANGHHSTNNLQPSQSYPTAGYSSPDFHPPPPTNRPATSDFHPSPTNRPAPSDFHPPPPTNRQETSDFSHPYNQQPYPQEPQQHFPPNYPSSETNYSYPNFQSYPSFSESSIPAVSSHYPSYYQGSDPSFSSPSAPLTTTYLPTAQYQPSNRNGTVTEPAPVPAPAPAPTPANTYQYDCNYQPPPEKIAEAHKAARFAVGALAFDDVSIAVEHLKKSLELLTIPSAGL